MRGFLACRRGTLTVTVFTASPRLTTYCPTPEICPLCPSLSCRYTSDCALRRSFSPRSSFIREMLSITVKSLNVGIVGLSPVGLLGSIITSCQQVTAFECSLFLTILLEPMCNNYCPVDPDRLPPAKMRLLRVPHAFRSGSCH